MKPWVLISIVLFNAIKLQVPKLGSHHPHTPVEFLSELVQDIDLVHVINRPVNPGFGGQNLLKYYLR